MVAVVENGPISPGDGPVAARGDRLLRPHAEGLVRRLGAVPAHHGGPRRRRGGRRVLAGRAG
eukprot:5553020-Pyramimonas_sp.AAC.1